MADFIAGYISGVASIILGSPLDIIKARLQTSPTGPTTYTFTTASSLLQGAAPPILTYGALNALLFGTYNRALPYLPSPTSLPSIFAAGLFAGLATAVISTPTELLKLRAQLTSATSWDTARTLLRTHGVRGLYIGGVVTAVREAVGYGAFFAVYEGMRERGGAGVLLAGGVAGCASWASVYPLDVVKTRVQMGMEEGRAWHGGKGALECARSAYREGGIRVFVDGLGICMARAFLVNAVQWAIYEYIMEQARGSTAIDPVAHEATA